MLNPKGFWRTLVSMSPVHLKLAGEHRRALLSILRWQKSVLRVVVLFGQLLDLVDERFCTAPEIVFRALVDGLIVEFGVVQHRLDLAREFVAILGDVANSLEIVGIYLVGGSDRAV
jgi:hypothetical protein